MRFASHRFSRGHIVGHASFVSRLDNRSRNHANRFGRGFSVGLRGTGQSNSTAGAISCLRERIAHSLLFFQVQDATLALRALKRLALELPTLRQQRKHLGYLVAALRGRRLHRLLRHDVSRHLVGRCLRNILACVRNIGRTLDHPHFVFGRRDLTVALALQFGGEARRDAGDRIDRIDSRRDHFGKQRTAALGRFALACGCSARICLGKLRRKRLTLLLRFE